MKLYLSMLGLFLYMTGTAQNFGFVEAPPLPPGALGRDDATVFVIGDKAYVGLGLREGFNLGNDFYVFDSPSDTWHAVADFPMVGRQYATGFALNGQGYVVAGVSAGDIRYRDVWKYDPVNDTWTQQNDFPGSKRYGVHSAVWNNSAYLFFGRDSVGFLKEVWKFDGSTWTQLPDFPSVARYQSGHVQSGDKVYFAGGYDATLLTDEVWRFDLQNETWTQLADFPGEARWYGRGFSFGDKIYIGTGWGSAFLGDFWSYDEVSQTWAQAPALPGLGRKGVMAFHVGGRALVGLGVNTEGARTPDFWEFVSNASLDEGTIATLDVRPNPAWHSIHINLQGFAQAADYKIVDVAGKALKKGRINVNEGILEIYVGDMPAGIYHLLLSGGSRRYAQKFCIAKN